LRLLSAKETERQAGVGRGSLNLRSEFRLQAVLNYTPFMSTPSYNWRHLTPVQREELLARRKERGHPWHSPPHRPNFGHSRFHITAACYEHRPYIGHTFERMDNFARNLVDLLQTHAKQTFAWCVLANHYHVLVETEDVLKLLDEFALFHGRTSHAWNGEENSRGRKIFFRPFERGIRSDRHFWATLNYVHHNPVHHQYVMSWSDWPWSSAAQYLELVGQAEAGRIWREYPVLDYGKGWDEAEL
jgi:putative transposase